MTTIIVIPAKATVIVDGVTRVVTATYPDNVRELQFFMGYKAFALYDDWTVSKIDESECAQYLSAWEVAGANKAALADAAVKAPTRDVLAELDDLKAQVTALEAK